MPLPTFDIFLIDSRLPASLAAADLDTWRGILSVVGTTSAVFLLLFVLILYNPSSI